MPRYDNTKITNSKRNQLRYKTFSKYNTTIYEKVPESDSDIFVISQEGDRLDLLATQFYGNPELWWYIAQTNNLNTMNIPAGTSLRISSIIEFAKGN